MDLVEWIHNAQIRLTALETPLPHPIIKKTRINRAHVAHRFAGYCAVTNGHWSRQKFAVGKCTIETMELESRLRKESVIIFSPILLKPINPQSDVYRLHWKISFYYFNTRSPRGWIRVDKVEYRAPLCGQRQFPAFHQIQYYRGKGVL